MWEQLSSACASFGLAHVYSLTVSAIEDHRLHIVGGGINGQPRNIVVSDIFVLLTRDKSVPLCLILRPLRGGSALQSPGSAQQDQHTSATPNGQCLIRTAAMMVSFYIAPLRQPSAKRGPCLSLPPAPSASVHKLRSLQRGAAQPHGCVPPPERCVHARAASASIPLVPCGQQVDDTNLWISESYTNLKYDCCCRVLRRSISCQIRCAKSSSDSRCSCRA